LDEDMAATFHAFIDRVWSGATIIDINELIEKNAERLRVQALNKLVKAQLSKTS
jgi:hypothetical protein